MKIRDYIESGAIESYVLGLAKPEEIKELEVLMEQYPELKEAIDQFSTELEEQAFNNAVPPPAFVKQKLITELGFEKASITAESPMVVAYNSNVENKPLEANVQSLGRWRLIAAASVILFIASCAANFILYNRYSSANARYQAILGERNTLQASNQFFQTQLKDYQSASQMMADPTFTIVQMKDPANKQNNMTTVFWDNKTKDVYLMANKLPLAAKDKQYQLWALVDGKPVDAGMLDPACTSLCKMKNIPRAQAFAITLEKQGGSPVPTMAELYVLGSI